MPPPTEAVFPLIMQSLTVVVPWLKIPAPFAAFPPVIVTLLIANVVFGEMKKIFPVVCLIVNCPAPGPLMVTFWLMVGNGSPRAKLIVPVTEKLIVSPAAAFTIASPKRQPAPGQLAALGEPSWRLVTVIVDVGVAMLAEPTRFRKGVGNNGGIGILRERRSSGFPFSRPLI